MAGTRVLVFIVFDLNCAPNWLSGSFAQVIWLSPLFNRIRPAELQVMVYYHEMTCKTP